MKDNTPKAASVVKMENNRAELLINLNGGAYFDFHLKELPLNPINFRPTKADELIFLGHFLCFDRWGSPSAGETANGYVHHGEVNTESWDMTSPPYIIDNQLTCSMK